MAIQTNEPRALSAALAAPAFTTRGAGVAMHVADRHIERWAPETTANRHGSLRSLGFVDRLVAPWLETAQRSASMRLFGGYSSLGFNERQVLTAASWVFPRPWYQDELDWMAAARQAETAEAQPSLFTTRGTFVAPAAATRPQFSQTFVAAPSQSPATVAGQQQLRTTLPAALYEYVAPSLSIASHATPLQLAAPAEGPASFAHAYSPLVSLAAVQAAEVMSRAVAPTMAVAAPAQQRLSPALRDVLSTMLARASVPAEVAPTRASQFAPQLVTPPAPQPERAPVAEVDSPATQLADRYAEQRARLVEVQRVAAAIAHREAAARAEAETRAVEQRTEQELARRIAETRAAEPRRIEPPVAETPVAPVAPGDAERARDFVGRPGARDIDDRVAQRLAERVAQRLHEQARAEAAQHARGAPPVEAPRTAPIAPVEQRTAPPEVLAAIAALPPELAAAIGRVSGADRRPERLLQTIDAIQDSFRAIELIARSSSTPETTHGPRLMMPAGMGGLVAAVDRAQVIADRPAALTGQHSLARPMVPHERAIAAPAAPAPVAPRFAPRAFGPAPVWVESPRHIPALGLAVATPAPTTALGAAIAYEPAAALGHVAWADRWIARFAGASPAALAAIGAALPASQFAASRPAFEALVGAAPHPIFVSPVFDTDRFALPRTEAPGVPAMPQAMLVGPSAERAALRVDDSAPTPDDVFVAIASATARARTAAVAPPAPPPVEIQRDRESAADVIARSAPVAPGAGLAPQLASSPFAPALRHMLPLPAAPTFDVRALFGDRVSATYLAGLLAPESHEVTALPAGEPWAPELVRGLAPGVAEPGPERAIPGFEPSYVAAEQPSTELMVPRERVIERSEMIADVAQHIEAPAAGAGPAPTAVAQETAQLTAAITTLRSALLSWDVVVPEAPVATQSATPGTAAPAMFAPAMFAPAIARTLAGEQAASGETAVQMLEAMSLPMLGDLSPVGDQSSVWTAPGMVANRAHSWSVAQERSTTDLSLDFVTPELVLAARVYGLGPAEAAQAARLAIAGPGQLSAMASTVDRTFVQAMAIEAERRERAAAAQDVAAPVAATPTPTAAIEPARIATAFPTGALVDDGARGVTAMLAPPAPSAFGVERRAPPAPSAFGVERRAPRGAFLWPSATVAALRLDAPPPDGEQSMSVAALELLAAQAVAEIGTFAAFGGDTRALDTGEAAPAVAGPEPGALPTAAAPAAIAARAPELRGVTPDAAEPEVLAAASAMVPSARRARFEALYVALGQSAASRTWSPAARAARALALASRTTSDDAPLSARERAMSAWDVLPVVYEPDAVESGDAMAPAGPSFAPTFVRGGRRVAGAPGELPTGDFDLAMPSAVDTRPGLSALSARAGEAISSYVAVAPTAQGAPDPSTRTSYEREVVDTAPRGPTAAQELVRTGRPAGRHGGGETEIPAWFEAAARKMLEERSSVSGDISMAELTFVAAAPPTQIAASSRSGSTSTAPSYPAGSGESGGGKGEKGDEDIEKIANDIYRSIIAMMDAARARNGEPYL